MTALTHEEHQAADHAGDDLDPESFSHDCVTCLRIELVDTVAHLGREFDYAAPGQQEVYAVREYARIAHLASRLGWLVSVEIGSGIRDRHLAGQLRVRDMPIEDVKAHFGPRVAELVAAGTETTA